TPQPRKVGLQLPRNVQQPEIDDMQKCFDVHFLINSRPGRSPCGTVNKNLWHTRLKHALQALTDIGCRHSLRNKGRKRNMLGKKWSTGGKSLWLRFFIPY